MKNPNNEKELDVEIIPSAETKLTQESVLKKGISKTTPTEEDLYTPDKTIEISGDDIVESPEIPVDLTKPNEIGTVVNKKTQPKPLKKGFVITPKVTKSEPTVISPEVIKSKPTFISPEPKTFNKDGDIETIKKPEEKEITKKPVSAEITPQEKTAVIKPLKKIEEEELKEKEILKEKSPIDVLKEDSEAKEITPEIQKTTTKEEGVPTEKKSFIKTVRTYQSDVVKTMKEQKTSLTKMVIAEKKKQKGAGGKIKKTEKRSTKKTILIISTVISIVVVGGLTGFYFLSEKQPEVPPTVTQLKIPTFIFPNYVREIFLTKLKRNQIIEAFESEKNTISIPLGSIIQLYLTKEDQTKQFMIEETEGNKLLITTEVFFNTIEAKTPSSLTRSLGSDFMFGYHSSLGNNPFLLFNVKSYNNVFSGMLEWEKTMLKDLSPVFSKDGSDITLERKDFQDIIIRNKDVRAILGSGGEIEFAYAFPDKETLVIINNETTFQELLRRITNARLERN